MTNEDVFAAVRKELGDAVEAANVHTEHTWDAGVVTTAPTYTTTGVMTYTCTECGETRTEEIPVLPVKPGDVNGDGVVNLMDIRSLKRYIADAVPAEIIVFANTDMDEDLSIGMKDLKLLKKAIVE